LFRLLHPQSSASFVSPPFQLTPSHIEEALELVALAFIMAVYTVVESIAVASIAARR
jgi:hypothetical protein